MRRVCAERGRLELLTSNLQLHDSNWESPLLNAHLFCIESIFSVNVGFLLQRYVSSAASLPSVQWPSREGGGHRMLHSSLGAVELPISKPRLACSCAGGDYGLGGHGIAADGGCWAAVGAGGERGGPSTRICHSSSLLQPCLVCP